MLRHKCFHTIQIFPHTADASIPCRRFHTKKARRLIKHQLSGSGCFKAAGFLIYTKSVALSAFSCANAWVTADIIIVTLSSEIIAILLILTFPFLINVFCVSFQKCLRRSTSAPGANRLFLGAAVIRRRFQLSRLSCLVYFDLMSVCMTGSLVSDQLIV